VTNIRVTVAATEIAKASRLGGEPETTSFWTSIGWAIEPSSGVARLRFWRASFENWITLSRATANGLLAGSCGRTASRMRWVFFSPRTLKVWPSRLKLPPLSSSVR